MDKTILSRIMSPVSSGPTGRMAKIRNFETRHIRSSSSRLLFLLPMLLLSILPLFSVAQGDFSATYDAITNPEGESTELVLDRFFPELVEANGSLAEVIHHEECTAGIYSHTDCWLKYKSGYSESFTGVNPSTLEIFAAIRSLSAQYDVPVEIIGAVCYKESGLCHYGADGFVIHNLAECKSLYNGTAGGPPGLGLMQLTGATAKGYETNRLISDWRYNLESGVKVLKQKYNKALSLNPSSSQATETGNLNMLENWRYALAFYNGYKNPENPYVSTVCGIISAPPTGLSRLFTGVAMARPQDEIE